MTPRTMQIIAYLQRAQQAQTEANNLLLLELQEVLAERDQAEGGEEGTAKAGKKKS